MNNSIKKMLENANRQHQKDQQNQESKKEKFQMNIKSTTKAAYNYVWSEIIKQYSEDLYNEISKERYLISINDIGLTGLYKLYKNQQISITTKEAIQILEYQEYNQNNADKITAIFINNDEVYVVLTNEFVTLLQGDGFIEITKGYYAINTTKIREYTTSNNNKKTKIRGLKRIFSKK